MDFDGVIVDGMKEYWWSSKTACTKLLLNKTCTKDIFSNQIPKSFIRMRPWINHGWEMVLLAAESTRKNSKLLNINDSAEYTKYQTYQQEAIKYWGWTPNQLQLSLETARINAIKKNRKSWLNLHQPFPRVIERFRQFDKEFIDTAILTTKGKSFTAEILNDFRIKPSFLFGHESGNKIDILKILCKERFIKGFIEDRLETLKAVKQDPTLSFINCYLASWGYLKGSERRNLPLGVSLLQSEIFQTPLASWR